MKETCFILAPSTKHPDSSQRRRPDSRQVWFSTCVMLAPSTKHPGSSQRRRPDSRQVWFSTCLMLAPSTKHPVYNQRRRPDSRQVLFSTCFMLAPSTKHPEETTRQQSRSDRHGLSNILKHSKTTNNVLVFKLSPTSSRGGSSSVPTGGGGWRLTLWGRLRTVELKLNRKKNKKKLDSNGGGGGGGLWHPTCPRSPTEQVKPVSFRWEGVDFKLGIRYAPLNWKIREYLLRFTTGWIAILLYRSQRGRVNNRNSDFLNIYIIRLLLLLNINIFMEVPQGLSAQVDFVFNFCQ